MDHPKYFRSSPMLLLAALVLAVGVQAAHEELLADGEQLDEGDY